MTTLLEGELAQTLTLVECVALYGLHAPGDDDLAEPASEETIVPNTFQTRAWFEDNLSQLLAPAERALSKCPDAAGNRDFLYAAALEPAVSNDLDAVQEAEHLRVCLSNSELFRGLPHPWRDFQTSDLCPPETEPAELTNVLG